MTLHVVVDVAHDCIRPPLAVTVYDVAPGTAPQVTLTERFPGNRDVTNGLDAGTVVGRSMTTWPDSRTVPVTVSPPTSLRKPPGAPAKSVAVSSREAGTVITVVGPGDTATVVAGAAVVTGAPVVDGTAVVTGAPVVTGTAVVVGTPVVDVPPPTAAMPG